MKKKIKFDGFAQPKVLRKNPEKCYCTSSKYI